ncbi:hypothetical protein [Nonomuraea salmonea]|uniref:hypothetical protein n=1 Tax=Nonomuraea salmonea TaxID=46181 RepID=UPI0031E7685C
MPREAWGLLAGGVRSRVVHLAAGSPWKDGLHLGVTALAAVQLAALLPYAGSLPLWTAVSALALLAVLRGWVWAAVPLTLAVGMKAVAIAGGRQIFDLTLLPVYPSPLGDHALFADGDPYVVAGGYAVTLAGLGGAGGARTAAACPVVVVVRGGPGGGVVGSALDGGGGPAVPLAQQDGRGGGGVRAGGLGRISDARPPVGAGRRHLSGGDLG